MPQGQNSTEGVGLYAAGGFVEFAEEIGEGLYGVFRAFVMMRWVEAFGDGVHVLAVELEAVESPVAEDFSY